MSHIPESLTASNHLLEIVAGDPIGDYSGFPDIQQALLDWNEEQPLPEKVLLDVSSVEDITRFFDLARQQQLVREERLLETHNIRPVKHAVRVPSGIIEINWLRVSLRTDSSTSASIDIRNVDKFPLTDFMRRTHVDTPVAVFDYARGQEMPAMHFVASENTHLRLSRFALPEAVEVVYPYEAMAAIDAHQPVAAIVKDGRL